jgi:hypothetical protein
VEVDDDTTALAGIGGTALNQPKALPSQPAHPRTNSLSMPDFDLDAFVATGLPQIPKTPRVPQQTEKEKEKFSKTHFTTNDMKTFELENLMNNKKGMMH